jgi:hypothetical protein
VPDHRAEVPSPAGQNAGIPDKPDPRPGESEVARVDRNFNEHLQELRVAQTGVQILFRKHLKYWIVRSADCAAQAGLILLALAVVTALTLVLGLVIVRPAAIGVAVGLAALIAVMWFVVPLTRRRHSGVRS